MPFVCETFKLLRSTNVVARNFRCPFAGVCTGESCDVLTSAEALDKTKLKRIGGVSEVRDQADEWLKNNDK